MMTARVLLLTVLFSGALDGAVPNWRYLPQPLIDPYSKPKFVDLDGDGYSEIIFFGKTLRGSSLVGVFGGSADGLMLADLLPLPSLALGDLTVISGDQGEVNLVVAFYSNFGSALWQLEGKPLRIIRAVELPLPIQLHQMVDLTGDGKPDGLGTVAWGAQVGRTVAFSYPEAKVLWMSEEAGGYPAALRLPPSHAHDVVISFNEGVRVLDGATGEERWRDPEGRIGRIEVGRFRGDPDTATFSVIGAQAITLFKSGPFEQFSEFSAPLGAFGFGASSFDVAGDGVDELLLSQWSDELISYAIGAHAMPNGDPIAMIPSEWSMPTTPVAGRLEKSGESVLFYASGSSHPSMPTEGVRVVDVESADVRFSSDIEAGPFQLTGFGDLDGTGEKQMVVLSAEKHQVYPYSWRLSVKIFDMDGNLLRARSGFGPPWPESDNSSFAMHLANVNGEGGDDIIFSASATSGLMNSFLIVDGSTLEVRWSHHQPALGSPLYERYPVAANAIDFDQDGLPDAVFIVRRLNTYRLLALSGLDGSLIVESNSIGNTGGPVPDMVVARFDEGEAGKIVISTGSEVRIYDPLAPEGYYVFGVQGVVYSVRVWGYGDQCRIGLLVNRNRIVERKCHEHKFFDDIPLPIDTDFFLPIDDHGGRFVVTRQGKLGVVGRDGAEGLSGDYWGQDLRGVAAHAMTPSNKRPDAIELLLGSDVQVVRFSIGAEVIFADGFEHAGEAE